MIVDSISEVDRAEWNALAAHAGFYSSHEWLSTVEPDGECLYILVRQDGRLVAALPVYMTSGTNTLYRPTTHFDQPLPRRPGEPVCLAGTFAGYRNEMLVDPALPEAERIRVLRRLAAAMEDATADAGSSHAYFLFLTSSGVTELAGLGGCTPPVPLLAAETRLSTVGTCFDDYLASLTTTRRKTTGKEIRRFTRAGLTVSVEPVWDHSDVLIRLVGNLNRKHGRGFTEREHAVVLVRQREHLADCAVLFVCRAGDTPVGMIMGFVWGDWLYLWYAGFDYDERPAVYEYFNVAIYEPLRYCYRNGLAGVHLGVGSHHAKAVRGARVEPLFASAWSVHPADDVVSRERRARVASYWSEQMRLAPRAFPAEPWRSVVGGVT